MKKLNSKEHHVATRGRLHLQNKQAEKKNGRRKENGSCKSFQEDDSISFISSNCSLETQRIRSHHLIMFSCGFLAVLCHCSERSDLIGPPPASRVFVGGNPSASSGRSRTCFDGSGCAQMNRVGSVCFYYKSFFFFLED